MDTINVDKLKPGQRTLNGYLAAIAAVLCWTGFNLVTRHGGQSVLSAFDLAALRFGVSGAIAMPFFLRHCYNQGCQDWPKLLILALVGGLAYALFAYAGFVLAPASHAAVFISGGIPLWTTLMALIQFGLRRDTRASLAFRPHVRTHFRHIAGMLACLIGLIFVADLNLASLRQQTVWQGDLLFLLAAAAWAVFSWLMHRWQIAPKRAVIGIASFCCVIYLPFYLLFLPHHISLSSPAEIALQAFYQGIIAAFVSAGTATPCIA